MPLLRPDAAKNKYFKMWSLELSAPKGVESAVLSQGTLGLGYWCFFLE